MQTYGNSENREKILFNYYNENKNDKMYINFILSLFLIIIVTIIYLALGKIDIIIKAPCTLRPNENISTVINTAEGYVIAKYTKHGNKVNTGDILFSIDPNDLIIEKANSMSIITKNNDKLYELVIYKNAIDSDINNITDIFSYIYAKSQRYFYETKRLKLNIETAKNKLNQEKAKHSMLQIPVVITEYEIELQIAINELNAFITNELMQIQNEKENINNETDKQNNNIKYIDEQLKKCEIKTPITGIYEEFTMFNVGDYLFSGTEIGRVIPDNNLNVLKVEILIESRYIAEIKNDLPFFIRFETLPSFEFGQVRGKLTNIGADIMVINDKSPVFIIHGVTEQEWIMNKEGYKVNLKPGMVGECRIIIKTKIIINHILGKIGFIK
jgi:membrane fusion protein, peptide pheromone/bacteriocin exporter